MTLPGGMRNPVPTLASPNGTASGDSGCPEFTEDLDVSGNQWVTDPPNGVVFWVFQPHIEQSFVSEWVSESTGIIPTYIILYYYITITIIFTCRDGTFKWA